MAVQLSPITHTCPKENAAGFTLTAEQIATLANALHDFYAAIDNPELRDGISATWKAREPEVNTLFQMLCNASLSLDAVHKAEK